MRVGPSASAQFPSPLRYGETRRSLGEGGHPHALYALRPSTVLGTTLSLSKGRATAFGLAAASRQPTLPAAFTCNELLDLCLGRHEVRAAVTCDDDRAHGVPHSDRSIQ
jgi:hypothetical protein